MLSGDGSTGAGRTDSAERSVRGVQLGGWLVYLVVRISICIAQALPIQTCDRLAHLLARVCFDVLRLRRDVVDENLSHAFPDWTADERARVGRSMWRHMILMIFELSHVPRKIHQTNWRKYVVCKDIDLLVRHLLSPRPVVIASGHFGNFEVGGVLAGLLGFPTYTIARPLDNPYLDRFMARYRGVRGQFLLRKKGSGAQADTVLRNRGTLVLLGDQYAGVKGCWVEFFGRPASCHKAVALFSIAHQAPLVVCYSRRLEQPLRFEVGVAGVFDPLEHPKANVRQIAQWYHTRLEELVRRDPEQYWWLHRRWKDPRGIAAKAVRRVDPHHVGPRPNSPHSGLPRSATVSSSELSGP